MHRRFRLLHVKPPDGLASRAKSVAQRTNNDAPWQGVTDGDGRRKAFRDWE